MVWCGIIIIIILSKQKIGNKNTQDNITQNIYSLCFHSLEDNTNHLAQSSFCRCLVDKVATG